MDRPPAEPVNLLDLVPVAAASSTMEGERVVLIRPRPKRRLRLRAPVDWLIFQLAPRRLRLDEVGSFCWLHLDGETTAGTIATRLRERFGESVEPAEERLGRFFQSLEREELLRFRD